jgi:NlpC/P60 family putative phage cell wall peptidase
LAARRWIGTPYVHQARARGAGCDCLGLVLGLWEEVLGPLPETPPRYTPDWSEMAREERLWSAASRHLVAKEPEVAAAGDVILFRMREGAVAKHLGVQSVTGAAPRFIHAWSGHGVVETRLTPPWVRRTVARFAFPERS